MESVLIGDSTTLLIWLWSATQTGIDPPFREARSSQLNKASRGLPGQRGEPVWW